ncbi:hypothetical protein [Sinorhizobium terangae]|uniref:hypothetical protein n=1 Tax=Sinorhizobium terangae TaxID=110322 RepID=UPI0024B26397|nr:hypothetical protein [Sinorhizobium terangae]WFU49172.1 hypothetical protein QA637_07175 [Sinorhizobium terangae]
MSQNGYVRLDFIGQIDGEHRQELRNWLERQYGRYFTRQETVLQCVVALRYADPSRPTVRELWHRLHHHIMEDARMLKGPRPQRLPSYSTFRARVADLPREFVWKARAGRDMGRPSIATMVSRFETILSSHR